MTEYVRKVKCGLRDEHGFVPREGSSAEEPVFDDIADGEYPMVIDGRLDHVRITKGRISCCNFDEAEKIPS